MLLNFGFLFINTVNIQTRLFLNNFIIKDTKNFFKFEKLTQNVSFSYKKPLVLNFYKIVILAAITLPSIANDSANIAFLINVLRNALQDQFL